MPTITKQLIENKAVPPGWCWACSCRLWRSSWSADRHSSLYIWRTWLTSSTARTARRGLRTERKQRKQKGGETERATGYLVEVTISHQLVLVLQSVLEQGPYDGLQFWVGGQQVGAEHLQPGVGQAVHYREGIGWAHIAVNVRQLYRDTNDLTGIETKFSLT